MPPTPAMFSIRTGCPRAVLSPGAMRRATRSVEPPGAYGTTIVSGRLGHDCDAPGTAMASPVEAIKSRATTRRSRKGRARCITLALLADVTWHGSKAGPLELPPVQARPAIRARRTLDYGGLAVVECDKRHTHSMEQGIGPV